MKAIKWNLAAIVAVVIGVIVASAVIPEKDCAGNNTWKTSEVCPSGK